MNTIGNAIGRLSTQFQLARLPQGSMGASLIAVLGGSSKFLALPVLSWKKEYGPYCNHAIMAHGYWDMRNVCWYEVDPKDLSESVMRSRDSRGKFVLLLKKDVLVEGNNGKNDSFPTVEVITPPIHPYLSKGDLSSFHTEAKNGPWITHIHQLELDPTWKRISSLLQGHTVKREAKEFDPGYPSPRIDFKSIIENLVES